MLRVFAGMDMEEEDQSHWGVGLNASGDINASGTKALLPLDY